MERELWSLLYAIACDLGNPWGGWKYSTPEIVVVYFWAVVHDRPMSWAVQKAHWPADLCPSRLPTQATLSRRMRHADAQQMMTDIENTWLAHWVATRLRLIRLLDGKALAVSNVSKDRDAGYGRGAGGMQKGYKLHAVWAWGPLPLAWALTPMNRSEKTMARELIPDLPGGGVCVGRYRVR